MGWVALWYGRLGWALGYFCGEIGLGTVGWVG